MSTSTLSFTSSSTFRDLLLVKNLTPYTVDGVYTPSTSNINTEVNLSNFNVVDSPDELITNGVFVNQLYPLNEYGPDGGYNLTINYNNPPLPVNSNQGEYDPTDTVLDIVNEFFIDAAYLDNYYGPVGGFNDMYGVTTQILGQPIHQPYGTNFVASFYSPYEILISTNPTGTNGTLSQDSFLARLGAQKLNELFQERISRQIFINTVGQVNLESLSDPFEASLIVTGQEPLVYRNWKITSPEDPITAAGDLLTRLGGAYWPVSLIPGNYFTDVTRNGQTQQTSNALNVVNQITGGFLGPILNLQRNPSEIFLANTGNGQRSVLFRNLDLNRYQPNYRRDFGGILGVGQAIINLIDPANGTLVGGYYVGNRNAEPSTITSPPNQVPVNAFGQQEQSPVYGPSEMGILYEGNQELLNFGLAGKPLVDGGGVDGQFVWTSPKYKSNAGFKATPGGGTGSVDEEFNLISANYLKGESTNITFKKTSILDQTQRLIDSADNVQGVSRLKHVGNAINQVSKVFNDGYKEITKGSRVVSYKDQTTGSEAGIEYCRVFTKDTPYYTYGDLQKTDGITTSGRRFSSSVLDNTFNLNIAPLRNPGSTNIIPNGPDGKGGKVKKYMFSIENLAWRTSSKQGYTYDDLPVCEKGPNGGRIMWFPPYELKFNDTSKANWNSASFLGRPEPMYTYKDTERTGQVSWKIIVDHPSILNVLVDKQLKGVNKDRVNSIIDSFFAGCVKYDIYELAKKFNTVPTKDLYTYQQIISYPNVTNEQIEEVKSEIATLPGGNTRDIDPAYSVPETNLENNLCDLDAKYSNFGLYFDNDIPGPPQRNKSEPNSTYKSDYDSYISQSNQNNYVDISKKTFAPGNTNLNVSEFFNNVVIDNFNYISNNFVEDAFKILSEGKAKIKMSLVASASAPANETYNRWLSKRRANSFIKYLESTKLGPFITTDRSLTFDSIETLGEETFSTPKTSSGSFGSSVNCTENIKDKNGKSTANSQKYSVAAMACRRVVISVITVTPIPSDKKIVPEQKPIIQEEIEIRKEPKKPEPTITIEQKLKEGIGKLVLRNLLSECDYFEVLKEEIPMVYDSIQEKIKYFNPAFHSITPEGLNARLTFLNQCVRPGETIPIIGTDGKPKQNDALNTSFGAPPVLILRIGDFYHTKIIPDNVAFTYEPLLDLNPEGIGIQPMIATVTLSFKFIGGMGLEKPVKELQNALSFNYYANTEIYDERATWTDDSWKKIDNEYFKELMDSQPTVSTANNQQENLAGETIGEILTTNEVESGQTGDISYKRIMDSLLDVTKEYYENVINQYESMVKSYNVGIWQLTTKELLYTEGEFNLFNKSNLVPIVGKSTFESKIDDLFTQTISDIDNNSNFIVSGLINENFNEDVLRQVKTNLKTYINEYKSDFSLGVNTVINNLVDQEVKMVQVFRKINYVTTLSDGIIVDNKEKIYNLSATTEVNERSIPEPVDTLEELTNDYFNVGVNITRFEEFLLNRNVIYKNYNSPGDFLTYSTAFTVDDLAGKRFFMIMAQIFNNRTKYDEFNDKIVTDEMDKNTEGLRKKYRRIVGDYRDKVKDELDEEEKSIKKIKRDELYKDFLTVENLYKKGKSRKFNYSTVVVESTIEEKKSNLNLLYKGNNGDNKTTWTDKTKFN